MKYQPLLLHCVQDFPKEMTDELSTQLSMGDAPPNVFRHVKRHLYAKLSEMYMKDFMKRYIHQVYTVRTIGYVHVHLGIERLID